MEFADRGTEDIFDGTPSLRARKVLPLVLHAKARNALALLGYADTLDDLRAPPGNRLEKLRGDRAGAFSIRINDRFRICFRWTELGPKDVEIVDYH